VNLPLVVVLGGLTILTLWGFAAPRSQWRVLTGWSHRDSSHDEPGAVILGIHRLVAGIALAGLALGGASVVGGLIDPAGQVSAPTNADPVRLLWGSPDPSVVNRVFVPVKVAPARLTREPVLRFQAVRPKTRSPGYLFGLGIYARPHDSATDGYLGASPTTGLSALDSADIVVQVRADRRCTPQQVLVVESDTAIVIAVYYGRPVGESLDAKALAAPCDPKASRDGSSSVLIPIELAAPVATRAVLNLEGTPISKTGSG
jgi:hypothetical protein